MCSSDETQNPPRSQNLQQQQQQQGGGEHETSNPEIEEIHEFQRFGFVSDSSDHYYATRNNNNVSGGGNAFKDHASRVYKKIMQEWRILKTHLPDTIYVRAYENRIDLMRAAIVGAAGTPYHDGIFFFDIAFPADYPARPPLIHYRSFGLRINPNLYASGLVCLSLLNTWHGKKSEIWSPSVSTMLQVLVSIQGLVLNEKPYYNEPGTGVWPGRGYWDKRSNAYSEDVFVLCCKTMMFLMRRAPKNFEGFVADHFRVTAPAILSACKAYIEGRASVGHYYASNVVDHDGSSSSSSLVQVSDKFKGAMRKLFPDLVDAFARSGASVGNFVEQLAVERNANPREIVDGKKKGGMGKWVWGKLKKALGFKKKKKKNSGKNKASSSK